MSGQLRLSGYEHYAVSGTSSNATAFGIYACVNLLPARAKYPEYKSKICAKGVFRSQSPRACKNIFLKKENHSLIHKFQLLSRKFWLIPEEAHDIIYLRVGISWLRSDTYQRVVS